LTKSQNDKISVIMPAHNAGKTITAALKSILQQSSKIDEVIIAIDASTDHTADAIESFINDLPDQSSPEPQNNDLPAFRIIHTDYESPSLARNAAIELSVGDFICFLDADDVWAKDKTTLQLDIMANNPEYLITCSNWTNKLSDLADITCKKTGFDVLSYHDLLLLNRFQTSTVIMKRSVIDQAGLFDQNFDGAEDWEFWIRSSKISDIAKINTPLVYYRDNTDGYSKNLKRHYLASKKIVERELSFDKTTFPSVSKSIIITALPTSAEKVSSGPKEIKSWHYLRFLVAFILIKEYKNGLSCLMDLVKAKSLSTAPRASYKLLYPFLKQRLKKRSGASR